MAFTPPPAVPQRGDRATFSDRVDAFLTWMANLIPQLNQFLAQLTSIAFGGAYAPPFTFTALQANITKPGALTSSNDGFLYFSDTDARGAATLAGMTSVFSGTSGIKAYVKVSAVNDPSRWLLFAVTTAYTHGSNAGYVSATITTSSGTLTEGESVVAQITRNGDKGDAANPALQFLGATTITSGVTAVNMLTAFSSTYDKFIIELEEVAAAASDTLAIRLATGGAAVSTSSYFGTAVDGTSSSAANMATLGGAGAGVRTLTIEIRNTNSTTSAIRGIGARGTNGATPVVREGYGSVATALTGFQLLWLANTAFSGGKILLYGVRNSN